MDPRFDIFNKIITKYGQKIQFRVIILYLQLGGHSITQIGGNFQNVH